MKKNGLRISGLLLGAALCSITLFTAGCSKDSAESLAGPDSPDARVALQITGGIGAQSRASGSSWAANDQIGIYMYAAGTTDIAEAANIPYVTADGSGAFSPIDESATIYFPADGSNVDFYAWYPYEDTETWTADLTDQSSQAALDLMTAEAMSGATVYNKEQPKVALSFQHRLSKLVVNILAGEGISEEDLAGLTVEITEQVGTVTYDPDLNAVDYVQELKIIPLLMTADGTFGEAIICPDDIVTDYSTDRGRQMIFTLGSTGEIFYYNIDAAKSFNTGEKNIYNITVNRVSIDVTSSVVDWTDGADEDISAMMDNAYTYTTDENGTRSYTVYNEAGLLAWNEYTRNGNWATNCTLAADITLTAPATEEESNWTAVGDFENLYTGTFDGNGYTITGLTIYASSNCQGLIGVLGEEGTVKDLTLEDVNISVTSDGYASYIGAVVGSNYYGNVTNCSTSGDISCFYFTGGVAGENYSGTVTACSYTGTVSGGFCAGGVAVGYDGSITGCNAEGSVNGDSYIGGVAGVNAYGGTITDCSYTGTVKGYYIVGGVVGENYDSSITACYFSGEVIGEDDHIGGVVGYNSGGGTVTDCYSTSSVTGKENTGGVAGQNRGIVVGCYASGSVTGTYQDTGGVVGYNHSNGNVTACYSIATVSAPYRTGGVVGLNDGSVTACYATGTVSCSDAESDPDYTGGVLGYNRDGTISTCYWNNNAANGISGPTASDEEAAYIDGTTVTWATAAETMNTVLTENSIAWKYVENSDSEGAPLLLEPKTE